MFKSAASLIADNVPPDSDLKIVNQLARLYQDNAYDSIIAVGGGSVWPEAAPEASRCHADYGGYGIGSDTGRRRQKS